MESELNFLKRHLQMLREDYSAAIMQYETQVAELEAEIEEYENSTSE